MVPVARSVASVCHTPVSPLCLARLKSAFARRTGRSADELHFEERRRSARVAEEENLYLEENGFSERSSRRARKEEAQLSEVERCQGCPLPLGHSETSQKHLPMTGPD